MSPSASQLGAHKDLPRHEKSGAVDKCTSVCMLNLMPQHGHAHIKLTLRCLPETELGLYRGCARPEAQVGEPPSMEGRRLEHGASTKGQHTLSPPAYNPRESADLFAQERPRPGLVGMVG